VTYFKFLSRSSHFMTWHDQWHRNWGFRQLFSELGPPAPGGRRVWGPKILCKKRILYYMWILEGQWVKIKICIEFEWDKAQNNEFLEVSNAVSSGLHIFSILDSSWDSTFWLESTLKIDHDSPSLPLLPPFLLFPSIPLEIGPPKFS